MTKIPISQLPQLASAPPGAAVLPFVYGDRTYQMPLADIRDAVWVAPPGTASQNVESFHAAIEEAAVSPTRVKTIFIPPGVYQLNDTVTFRNLRGARIVGSGFSTTLQWMGDDAAKPFLKVAHCYHCTFEQFEMIVSSAAYAAVQILRDNVAPSDLPPTANVFRNIHVGGNGNMRYGVVIGGEPGTVTDANNDFHCFENVFVAAYQDAGWYLPNSQAYGTSMRNCAAVAGGTGKYGVYAGNSQQNVGGHFNWHGGTMTGHAESDLFMGRSEQPYIINGLQSENSARLLELGLELYHLVSVSNVRWTGIQLHADGAAIKTTGLVNLLVDTCWIGGGMHPMNELHFDFINPGALSSIRITNNIIATAAENVFREGQPTLTDGNHKVTSHVPYTIEAL